MRNQDLSRLDRNTLRAWRIANLVGWSGGGAVVGAVTFVITIRATGGLIDALTHDSPGLTVILIAVAISLGGVAAGTVIGRHVYRSPGSLAVGAILLPSLFLLFNARVDSPVELLFALLVAGLGSVVAAAVAATVFRRRPRALRAPR